MLNHNQVFEQLEGKLIVSCQALPDEPLHSSFIMGKMALAAQLGGARGIRANGIEDIREIKKQVSLPIIGIIKSTYENSNVFITPTLAEIKSLNEEGVDIIALDATDRVRPSGEKLEHFFKKIRKLFPKQIFMADCSTYEEAIKAESLGFDCVSTTLSGYTDYTSNVELPNFSMMEELVRDCQLPVIAEGGIWTPSQLRKSFDIGVHSAVIGTAITRPMEITRRFNEVVE